MSEGRIQLDFGTLNPIQRQVSEEFRKGKRFVAMITGRQGGKSHYGARWLISQIATGRARISSPSWLRPLSGMRVSPSAS